jgi:chemotaxis signal transduction protein
MARDAETARRVLQERADALARPPRSEDRSEMIGTVGLRLGSERYAVELHTVVGIETTVTITALPGTPKIWAGLANVHGALQPVLDLREYLGVSAPDAPQADGSTVVLVAAGGLRVGLLCDDASDVRWIPAADVMPPPPARGRRTRSVLRGLTPDLVGLLNLELLLSDPALVVDDGL